MAKSKTRDMTKGSIFLQIVAFALPLLLGNIFQMLYNTVDTIVVGQFVGKEALAAVGSTTMIVNMMVFFFNGFSVGAGVVISHSFGAKNREMLHTAIETTMAMTFLICVVFTVIGVIFVRPMLLFMSTPEDVMADATTYLRIYFFGISGLLIYNMGSGILRAVGDTRRPLYFLVLTSVVNILLDLLFVVVIPLGIAGVAIATILSQFISAVLTMLLLIRTDDIYKLTFHDLKIHGKTLVQILGIGLPTAIQSTITAFSNVFVQSYVNVFGSSVMAGWSCYNKIDSFIMLPMGSVANAATTFVSQNLGAGEEERADRGTVISLVITLSITALIATPIYFLAAPATRMFTNDSEVIGYSVLFLKTNIFFLLFNCVNHVLAGALRGRGDSRAPMIIMLSTFVGVRQLYLYLATHFIANTEKIVGLGYPVGWTMCFIVEVTYFLITSAIRKKKRRLPEVGNGNR